MMNVKKYFICFAMAAFSIGFADAAVVARPTASAPSRAQAAPVARVPSLAVQQSPTPVAVVIEEEIIVEEVVAGPDLENRAAAFSAMMSDTNAATRSGNDDAMARRIQEQRAAIAAGEASSAATANIAAMTGTGRGNACDNALRECMSAECGNDFTKCALDGDQVWGRKIDICARNANCSGRELTIFAAEIKSDRDMNALLGRFTEIKECGDNYRACIFRACGGRGLSRCLSKSGGDRAIADCEQVYRGCQSADNGLRARAMELFASVRVDAERDVARLEQRLYAIREQMQNECRAMRGTLDTRSLECVFSVEFMVGGSTTPFASRNIGAGMTYQCSEDWFGVDVTTFREHAAAITREQAGRRAELVGAGLGMAAGALASGVVGRGLETNKARREVDRAKNQTMAELDKATPQTRALTNADCERDGLVLRNGECIEDVADVALEHHDFSMSDEEFGETMAAIPVGNIPPSTTTPVTTPQVSASDLFATFSLNANTLFNSGRYNLADRDLARNELSRALAIMNDAKLANACFDIIGHTDSQNIRASADNCLANNQALSECRAQKVMEYFESQNPNLRGRLVSSGEGASRCPDQSGQSSPGCRTINIVAVECQL
ncbi:MAG: OmpA family protein [Alphaproteobacteria bacterium]|nr:OmpA family protein [Alphaproteobacteria bacterium]MCL2889749.1 OmpA family protein [Alphaproteobacteria bacterium]